METKTLPDREAYGALWTRGSHLVCVHLHSPPSGAIPFLSVFPKASGAPSLLLSLSLLTLIALRAYDMLASGDQGQAGHRGQMEEFQSGPVDHAPLGSGRAP